MNAFSSSIFCKMAPDDTIVHEKSFERQLTYYKEKVWDIEGQHKYKKIEIRANYAADFV